MIRRRAFLLTGSAAVAWPFAARAQSSRVPRLGVLLIGNEEPFWSEFRAGLRDFNYVNGQNVQIEVRSGKGQIAALPALAEELVRMKPELIVASETPAVEAARRATSDIPIVMAPSGDPVGTGQVASLARPGGNVTGLSAATAELAGKSLELLRETLPKVERVAALVDPVNLFTKPFLEQIGIAARALRIEVQVANVRRPEDFDAAFEEMVKQRADAVIVQPTLPRPPSIKLSLQHKLPGVSGNRAYADAGGLMSYAASLADRYREAAGYVDKILRGRKPADLPIQQPTRFELVINQKTGQALGITIPASVLLRADEVLQVTRGRGNAAADSAALGWRRVASEISHRDGRDRVRGIAGDRPDGDLDFLSSSPGRFDPDSARANRRCGRKDQPVRQGNRAAARLAGASTLDGNHAERAAHRRHPSLGQVPAITELAVLDDLGREQLRISRLTVDVIGSGVDRSDEPLISRG